MAAAAITGGRMRLAGALAAGFAAGLYTAYRYIWRFIHIAREH